MHAFTQIPWIKKFAKMAGECGISHKHTKLAKH